MRPHRPLALRGELARQLQLDLKRVARFGQLLDVPFDAVEPLLFGDVAFARHICGSIAGTNDFVTSNIAPCK